MNDLGWMENNGTFNNKSGATLTHNGTMNNGGTLNNDGTLNNKSAATWNNGSTLNNGGTLNNDGRLNNNSKATLNNSGLLNNNKTLQNDYKFYNNSTATLTNTGTLTNTWLLENRHGGTLANSGTIEIAGGGTLHNDGTLSNYTGGTLTNSGHVLNAGIFGNDGQIDNTNGTFVNNGRFSGDGTFVGTFDDAGVLAPGNSAGVMTFTGDVSKTAGSTEIELGGVFDGGTDKSLTEYDWLDVTGDVALGGKLDVSLIEGFKLHPNNLFDILRVGGTLSGQYDGLGEGALVGNFGGQDLFITYGGGDGNDVTLFTAYSNAVPEPTTMLIWSMLAGLGMTTRRRRAA